MFIYNVTVNIEQDVKDEWLLWMRGTHIPEVMDTGFFKDWKMLRLINEEPGNTGVTFAIQYRCENLSLLNNYLTKEAPRLQKALQTAFPNKHVAFRTVLEEL